MDRSAAPVTDREAEVLTQVASGRSNAQIGHALHISVRTVENHVSSLLRKLGAADRRELAALAGPRAPRPDRDSRQLPGHVPGLPHGRGTFVGRRSDQAAVLDAFEEHRLVTVVGPGGMGKTRLVSVVAHEASSRFPAGTAFVDLVPVPAGRVAESVAGVLGVGEVPGQEPTPAIAGAVGAGRFLLVLDNCEHLLDDVGALAGALLDRCPHLTVLATTRQRLGLPDERLVRLGPLSTEPDAVRLFLDRARVADPDLALDRDVVADICDHLDGMPLAIELAAARAASLGQDGLRAAIGDQVRLLRGGRGSAARHGSLEAVMGWSHELLAADERTMLRALSVFAGSFDLGAVAAVTDLTEVGAADLLGRLVDCSLVVRSPGGGGTRWRLLETVRAFADAQVPEAERELLVRRHLDWAAATAGHLEDAVEHGVGSGLDLVVDDLRAALARASGPDAGAHRLARSTARLLFARGHLREARECAVAPAGLTTEGRESFDDLRTAADVAVAGSDTQRGVDLLLLAAEQVGDHGTRAATAWAQALETQIRFGYEYRDDDPPGRRAELLAAATREADPADPSTTAVLATARAWHEGEVTRTDLARDAVEVARRTDDPVLLLRALDVLSATLINRGRLHDALDVAAERMRLLPGVSRYRPAAATEISDTFQVAINLAVSTGELAVAGAYLDRAEREDPTPNPFVSLPRRIAVRCLTGRFAAATEHGEELWQAWERDGTDRPWLAPAVNLVALAHGLSGTGGYDAWRARTSQVALDGRASTEWMTARAAFVDARTALHTGDLAGADALVERAFASQPTWAHRSDGYARAAGAELAVVAGLPDAADRIATAEPYAAENRWAAATLARARWRLHGDRADLETAALLFAEIGAEFERSEAARLLT